MIIASIFPGESVGASAGIFAVIGAFIILLSARKIPVKKFEIIILLVFSIMSLALGIESLITHFIALISGIIFGIVMKKKFAAGDSTEKEETDGRQRAGTDDLFPGN